MSERSEYIEVQCPEGHGEVELEIVLLSHTNSRGQNDRTALLETKCQLRDELLGQGGDCSFSCNKLDAVMLFLR